MLNRLRSTAALSAVVILPMLHSAALAQDATEQPAAGADAGDKLQQVVVTANRRAESINDVSTAITAIGKDDLRNANIDDIKDLQVCEPPPQPAQPQPPNDPAIINAVLPAFCRCAHRIALLPARSFARNADS